MSLTAYGGKKRREREILYIKLRAKEYITSSVANIPYAVSVLSYKFCNIRGGWSLDF
jgi:hypothetical protein